MNRIVEILMKRDGDSQDIAEARVRETRDELLSLTNLEDMMDYDDIIYEYLGLEPDYLDDILSMN